MPNILPLCGVRSGFCSWLVSMQLFIGLSYTVQFAVEEQKTSEKLSSALESVIQIVLRAEEYARLFSVPPNTATDRIFQSLQNNLTHLYAEVLNFLVRATIFFQKPTLRKTMSIDTPRRLTDCVQVAISLQDCPLTRSLRLF